MTGECKSVVEDATPGGIEFSPPFQRFVIATTPPL